MTKKKQMIALLMVLAALAAVYLGIKIYSDWNYQKEAEKTSEELAVTDLDTEKIQKVSYTDGANTVTFAKTEDTWGYTADAALPLKQSCAEDVVSDFADITGNRKLSDTDPADAYGLTSPAYTVTLTDSAGKETKVEVGNSTDTDYYLTADGGKTVFTVSSTIVDSLVFDTDAMIQTETFPAIDSDTLKSFTIEQKGKTLVSCTDEEELSEYGSELSGISLDTCLTYKVTDKELKQYGLDKAARKTMTAVYTDGDTEKESVFYMGTVFKEEDTEYAYMQLKDSKMVYKVFVSDTEKLIAQ